MNKVRTYDMTVDLTRGRRDASDIEPEIPVASLKSKLPIYLAAVEGISSINPLEWWHNNADKLPNWASAFRKVALMQRSSATAEHVFSILSFTFSKLQTVSLEDYIQLSVMMQYNN